MAFYRCGWLLDRGDAPQCPTNMAKLTLTVSKSTSLAYQGCSKKPSKSKCLGCPDWREPSADARLQCRQKHHALQRQVKECQKGFSPRCDFQGCVVPGGKLPPLHSLDWQYIYIYIIVFLGPCGVAWPRDLPREVRMFWRQNEQNIDIP